MKKEADKIVISECLYRRSSDLKRCKDTGFAIQAFANDDAFKVNGTYMMELIKVIVVSFLFSSVVYAEDKEKAEKDKKNNEVKELSGISIIGNKEAPKSLYIVPWKNSEVGVRSSLTSGLLDKSMRPIDKEVFMRELDFYELSH